MNAKNESKSKTILDWIKFGVDKFAYMDRVGIHFIIRSECEHVPMKCRDPASGRYYTKLVLEERPKVILHREAESIYDDLYS